MSILKSKNPCGNCGDEVTGLFVKKCKSCGIKENDFYVRCKYCGRKQHKDNKYCEMDGAQNWKINKESKNDGVKSVQKTDEVISPEPRIENSITSLEDAFNAYQFYFEVLPFIWDSSERRSMMFSHFEAKGGKECMSLILSAMNLVFFPDQQNNAVLKIIGMKLVEDFNNENYLKLFSIDRINFDSRHLILKIEFPDYSNQKELVKVERVFLVCTVDFSQGKVITIESNPIMEGKHVCEVKSNGDRYNFGTVQENEIYDKLKSII